MRFDHLKALNAARRDRRAVIRLTDLETGRSDLFDRKDDWRGHPLADAFDRAFRTGRSGIVTDADGKDLFLAVHVPAPRLVVIGAVHISQAMAPIAAVAGFAMTVIDPRTAFATAERFPGVPVLADWPEEVLPGLQLDSYTAFAALTHDPKIDDWALAHALEKDCFYVGALGSRKTHASRLERLARSGVPPAALARIEAPIGADIGAASPAEIAIAILASVIAALRRGEGGRSADGAEAAA